MPPRKRVRVSQAASSTPPSNPKTPTPVEATASPSKSDADLLADPWTDEEEAALFRAIIKTKPTGIHKHFRMLTLHNFLLANGYIHPRNEHTRPAGIWRKLQSLYDLEALDEREDARQLSDLSLESSNGEDEGEDDVYSEAENKIHREDFSLPDDDFGELKWRQRFADETEREDESPAALPELNLATEPPVRFTPSFSVEPSEAATPSGRGGRARSGTTNRGKAKATPAAAAAASTRRSARQAGSVAEEEEKEEEEAEEEEVEPESEEEEEQESEASTPAPRSTKTSRGRGRGGTRGRGRGRGRGR